MAETLKFQGLRGELRENEPMSKHVSWRAGGPARRFFAPADLEDLSAFLGQLPPEEPLLFVGLGILVLIPPSQAGGRVSPLWLALVYLLHTIGELCLSPVGLSAMTKLAL